MDQQKRQWLSDEASRQSSLQSIMETPFQQIQCPTPPYNLFRPPPYPPGSTTLPSQPSSTLYGTTTLIT